MTFADRVRKIFAFGRTTPDRLGSNYVAFIGRPFAGVRVTPDEAYRNPVVIACLRYLSSTVAQLPWSVMAETGTGRERMNAHPVHRILHNRPCPEYGSFAWRQTMVAHAALRGNAYAEIERDLRGVPVALWPIHPDRVCPRRAADQSLVYEVWNNGGNTVLAANDVFHLRGFGEGPVGLNIVEYAAQSIGWAQATELFGANYFAEGMNPSGIIEAAAGMSPEAMKTLRTEAESLYKGPRGKRTMILDAGMKFQKLSTSPDDSQFIETMQHQVEQICRWFGVPPHKVMHLLRATFSNIEHQSIEVVIDSVTPWVKALEEEADYKLFGNNRQGFYTKIDLQALLRGDNKSRGEFYKTLAGLGWSFNEICALEDRNGIGPDGDRRFRSVQLQPIDAVAKVAVDTMVEDDDDQPVLRNEWPIAPPQLRN